MKSWIAMLRTVETEDGGRVTMSRWRQLAFHCGAREPRTYLQGGNLVFDIDGDGFDEVVSTLREAMKVEYETDIPMVLRSGAAMQSAANRSPFHAQAEMHPRSVWLGFLSEIPDPEKVAALDAGRSDQDRFVVQGDVVHLLYTGEPSRSRLSPEWFEEQLGVTCALRSWQGVRELVKMAGPPPDAGPGLRGLSYVMVMVADMDRSLAFYRDVLGLETTVESPYWSEIQAGGVRLALHAGGEGERPATDLGGMASLGFDVADLKATHAALVERGLEFVQPPTERKEEGIVLAVAKDPDGLILNFAQHTR